MVQVRKSTVIAAPVDAVWAIVRDFNAHDQWHPAVADSLIEAGLATDAVGAVRSFHLTGGEHLRERLISLSDHDYTLSYCLIQTPIPLNNYVAHIRLIPVTDGNRTYWEWTSSFDPPTGQEQALSQLVGENVYEAGFDAVRALLEPKRLQSGPDEAPATPAVRHPARAPSKAAHELQATAIMLASHGDASHLVPESITVPAPASGQVRVRHTAIGINYIDIYCRTGRFDLIDLPGVPGLEAAGIVLDTGADVSSVQPGDRVAYASLPPGAYCEVRNIAADHLVRLPDQISDETAAGGLVKGLTAHFLLHEVHRLRAGETVLVHAAAGGVGLLLCQWAAALGARVIGTVSSEAKAAVAREHGCEHVILYTENDFVAAVHALTEGRGADLVVDGVGRQTFDDSIAALANRGHLVSYGQASGDIGQRDVDRLAAKSITLSRPNFDHYTETPAQLQQGSARLFEMLTRQLLQVRIDRRFGLGEAAQAHRWLESRQSIGSNLLIP